MPLKFKKINNVEFFASYSNATPKSARITELETRMEHTADSFNDICNMVELAGSSGSGGRVDCCVDGTNNRMFCNTRTNLNGFLSYYMIATTGSEGDGVCDRRSQQDPPTINRCHNDFVNPSGK